MLSEKELYERCVSEPNRNKWFGRVLRERFYRPQFKKR